MSWFFTLWEEGGYLKCGISNADAKRPVAWLEEMAGKCCPAPISTGAYPPWWKARGPEAISAGVHNCQLTNNIENKSRYVICGHILQC